MVLNVLSTLESRLSYFTTGQEVPDDLEPGDPLRLARLIVSRKVSVEQAWGDPASQEQSIAC
jgi:flagellar biosynthesis GTPase FlhF